MKVELEQKEIDVILEALNYAEDNGYFDDVVDQESYESAMSKLKNAGEQ